MVTVDPVKRFCVLEKERIGAVVSVVPVIFALHVSVVPTDQPLLQGSPVHDQFHGPLQVTVGVLPVTLQRLFTGIEATVVLFALPHDPFAPLVGPHHVGAVGTTLLDPGEARSADHRAFVAFTVKVYATHAVRPFTVIGLPAHVVGDHPPLGCTW